MGKGRRRLRDAPHVQPVDVDGVRTVAILTILWAVGFVVLAFNRERLDQAGMGWLLWTCLAGVGLGLLGIEYTRKRRDAIAEAELEAEAEEDEELGGDSDEDTPEDEPAPDPSGAGTGDRRRRGRRSPAEPIEPGGPDRPGDLAEPVRPDQTATRPIPYAQPNPLNDPSAPPRTPAPGENPPTDPGHRTGRGALPPADPLGGPAYPEPFPSTNPATGFSPASPEPLAPSPPSTSPGGTAPGLMYGSSATFGGVPDEGRQTPPPGVPAVHHEETGGADTGPFSPAEPAGEPARSSSPTPDPVEPTAPRRRRRQSQGPARPGRVDVGNVNSAVPQEEYQPRRAAGSSEPSEQTVSPMWSELIEPTPPPATSTPPPGSDDILLDDATLGGRRAKRYDMTEDIQELTGEIQEITEGGGTVYRGRRARRRPDSA
ncbi:DUF2530 domain-containing protein [Phytoactinopolyspora mesophila]|uniref:DUF2530 domain-containing protein n=1 Tax=Phytoactinopolyspora mesophila TaxID=2650750 RepID=UPI001C9E3B4E|nr:DUF2530 domain-containing protein [Phytoactinopolyspora mesophila]